MVEKAHCFTCWYTQLQAEVKMLETRKHTILANDLEYHTFSVRINVETEQAVYQL